MVPEGRRSHSVWLSIWGWLEWQVVGNGGSHLIPNIDVSAYWEIAFSPLRGLK